MDTKDSKNTLDFQTRERVEMLLLAGGGQTKLARKIGLEEGKGRQRVDYWRRQGRIPELAMLKWGGKFKRIMGAHERRIAKQELKANGLSSDK